MAHLCSTSSGGCGYWKICWGKEKVVMVEEEEEEEEGDQLN